jgi:hypothetical protein
MLTLIKERKTRRTSIFMCETTQKTPGGQPNFCKRWYNTKSPRLTIVKNKEWW